MDGRHTHTHAIPTPESGLGVPREPKQSPLPSQPPPLLRLAKKPKALLSFFHAGSHAASSSASATYAEHVCARLRTASQ